MTFIPGIEDFDWFHGNKFREGPWLLWDIETNGLLPDVDKLHSLCIRDVRTGERWSCASDTSHGHLSLKEGKELVADAALSFGHNMLRYDEPVLRHLDPKWNHGAILIDTLVLAKMLWPIDILKQKDFPKWRAGKLPGQLIGAQGLEAWGYRTGTQKGEYSKTVKEWSKAYQAEGLMAVPPEFRCLKSKDKSGKNILDPWLAWNVPMQDYCDMDIDGNGALLELIVGHLNGTCKQAKGVGWSASSVHTEHRVWMHVAEQETVGFGFDIEEARKFTAKLKTRQAELESVLKEYFPPWWDARSNKTTGDLSGADRKVKMTQFPDVTIPRYSEKTGKRLKDYVGPPLCEYRTDAPFVRVVWTEFNPKSRAHLGQRLQEVYGWEPLEFGGAKGDQAKVDETTIKDISASILPEDVKQHVLEYLVVSKTLGQIADGRKSWIDLYDELDGSIKGKVDPLGTISHRGSHRDPNLAQVMAVKKEDVKDEDGNKTGEEKIVWGWKGGFGAESRSLFTPRHKIKRPERWVQSGTDASGLELRVLGEYLWPYDDGLFAERVSTPGLDIHGEHAKIIDLPRAETKTTTYAFIFGAGNLKLGLGVGLTGDEEETLADSGSARSYAAWLARKGLPSVDRRTLALVTKGGIVKRKLLDGITGLKDLQKDLTSEAEVGFIVALDGRKLAIRKKHATLNQALQGGGAIICKLWMLRMEELLALEGLRRRVDYNQMAFIHDELAFEHRPGLEEVIAATSKQAMKEAAEMLNLRTSFTTETKHGGNWMETH